MPANQYVAFATGGGANTLSNATYQAHPTRPIGHQPGIALSELENTVLRQCSVAASGVATLAATYGSLDCLDDGSPTNYAAAVKSALDAIIAAAITNFSSTLVIPTVVQGNFTPQVRFGGTGTGITYSSQSGIYIKVNKLVNFWLGVTLSNKGSSTGHATVTGLPFAVNGLCLCHVGGDFLNLGADLAIGGVLPNATTEVSLRRFNANGNPDPLNESHFTNSSIIYLTGSYPTP